MKRRTLLAACAASAAASLAGCNVPQALPAVNTLIFKGTHNSYDPRRRVPPWTQVDHYGVWVLELDYLVPSPHLRERHPAWNTKPPAVVIGHDGPGEAADGAGAVFGGPDFLLVDYLTKLAQTEASRYRPLIVYLDRKDPDSRDVFYYDNPSLMASLLDGCLQRAFHERIFGPAQLRAKGGWPDVQQLAGHVIAISNQDNVFSELLFYQPSGDAAPPGPPLADKTPFLVGPELDVGLLPFEAPCERWQPTSPGQPNPQDLPFNVWRLDSFSADDTFQYAVPPNPIIVNPAAPPIATDETLFCGPTTSPQGTRLAPFRSVADAVRRASGFADGSAANRYRRSGYGFTVLAYNTNESVPVDFPLTIKYVRPRPI
jgi:hypothetical protein